MAGRNPPIRIADPDISHPRVPVSSSAISHVGYDEEFEVLYLTWKPRAGDDPMSYVYFEVPPDVFESLMGAASMGTFANKFIKPVYECYPE